MKPVDLLYIATLDKYLKHIFKEALTHELACDDNSPYWEFIQSANADGYITYKVLESLCNGTTTRRSYELQLTPLGDLYVNYLLL